MGIIIDLTSKRFGNLTVASQAGKNKWSQVLWKCLCDCGNLSIVHGRELRNGSTKSCGCLKRRKGIHNPRFKGYHGISGTKWHRIKYGALKRSLDFKINIKETWELLEKQDFICALSGECIRENFSLDRIESLEGYIPGNIQWVHPVINQMKWEFSISKFLTLCYLIFLNSENLTGFSQDCISIFPMHKNFQGIGNLSKKQWGKINRAAQSKRRGKRKWKVLLTLEQAWNKFLKQNGRCILTGLPICLLPTPLRTASLDRQDSFNDYTLDNIQWIHKDVNKMKHQMNNVELLSWCKKIVFHQNLRLT